MFWKNPGFSQDFMGFRGSKTNTKRLEKLKWKCSKYLDLIEVFLQNWPMKVAFFCVKSVKYSDFGRIFCESGDPCFLVRVSTVARPCGTALWSLRPGENGMRHGICMGFAMNLLTGQCSSQRETHEKVDIAWHLWHHPTATIWAGILPSWRVFEKMWQKCFGCRVVLRQMMRWWDDERPSANVHEVIVFVEDVTKRRVLSRLWQVRLDSSLLSARAFASAIWAGLGQLARCHVQDALRHGMAYTVNPITCFPNVSNLMDRRVPLVVMMAEKETEHVESWAQDGTPQWMGQLEGCREKYGAAKESNTCRHRRDQWSARMKKSVNMKGCIETYLVVSP